LPARQGSQAVAPEVENFPSGQWVHTEELGAPAMTENVPAGQILHEEMLLAPETFENFPSSHGVHDIAPVPE